VRNSKKSHYPGHSKLDTQHHSTNPSLSCWSNPGQPCSEIPTSCSSGYYWVRSSNGTAVQVYCDTQRVCGYSNTTGWTHVASLFFCESGRNPGTLFNQTLHESDPLRDGQGFGSPPCCDLSSPSGVTAPWFYKQLPQDDLEVCICRNEGGGGTPVELVQLYIR